MYKNNFLVVFFFIVGLFACTSGNERNTAEKLSPREGIDSLEALQEEPNRRETASTSDTLGFKTAFNHFFTALQTSDTTILNRFIHPMTGLWIIEQPGAVPKMTRVTEISSFEREYQNRSFFTVAQEVKECDLQEEPLPDFNCADMEAGRTGYAKDGCFVWDAEKFRDSGYWNYASLSDAQIEQVKAALPLIQQTVLHTKTSFEFYFGYTDGQWYLFFAKLIYPCSA